MQQIRVRISLGMGELEGFGKDSDAASPVNPMPLKKGIQGAVQVSVPSNFGIASDVKCRLGDFFFKLPWEFG